MKRYEHPDYGPCSSCFAALKLRTDGMVRKHAGLRKATCSGSGLPPAVCACRGDQLRPQRVEVVTIDDPFERRAYFDADVAAEIRITCQFGEEHIASITDDGYVIADELYYLRECVCPTCGDTRRIASTDPDVSSIVCDVCDNAGLQWA